MKFMDQNNEISKILYSLLQLEIDSDLEFWNVTFDKDKSELIAKFRKRKNNQHSDKKVKQR